MQQIKRNIPIIRSIQTESILPSQIIDIPLIIRFIENKCIIIEIMCMFVGLIFL